MRRTVLFGSLLLAGGLNLNGCVQDPEGGPGLNGLDFEPTVAIEAPVDNAAYSAGDSIIFRGRVRDLEDPPEKLSARWSSDQDGILGESVADGEGEVLLVLHDLSASRHRITLSATDSDGNVGVDSVTVFNNLPGAVAVQPPVREGDGIRLTWSMSHAPDFESYQIYRSLGAWSEGDNQLIATLTSPADTTYLDAGAVFGIVNAYQVRVSNRDGLVNAAGAVAMTLTNIGVRFPFACADACLHPTEPWLYLTDKAGHKVYKVDFATATVVDSMAFDYMAESLDIRDTGSGVELYVALLVQDHSSYWWEEEQSGFIAVLDADSFDLITTLAIATDPYDIVAGRDGLLFIPSGSGQWTDIVSYDRATGLQVGSGFIRQESEAHLHPVYDQIYTMDTDLSPRDIDVFQVDGGVFRDHYDSPYHGTYSMGHPFAISPSGEYLVTARGTIFSCTDDVDTDLRFITSIPSTNIRGIAFAHEQGLFYVSQGNEFISYDEETFAYSGTQISEGDARFLFFRSGRIVAVVEPHFEDAGFVTGVETIDLEPGK